MLNFSIILKTKIITPKSKSKNQINYLMKKFLAAILFVTLSSFGFISSTDWTTYTWEDYNLEVTVPDYLRIKKNNGSDFELSGKGMEMAMHVFEEKISKNEMDDAVIEAASDMELTEIDAEHEIEGDGLDGYYVEGFKNGKRVVFAGMIDPKSRTNFFLAITFNDRDKKAEADALEIVSNVRSLN
jgi:hypothetical protein